MDVRDGGSRPAHGQRLDRRDQFRGDTGGTFISARRSCELPRTDASGPSLQGSHRDAGVLRDPRPRHTVEVLAHKLGFLPVAEVRHDPSSGPLDVIGQVPVDRGPGYPEGVGDLLHGVRTLVVHRAGLSNLRRRHLELWAALTPPSSRRRQAIMRPFHNQVVLELGDRGEHVEEQPPARCGRIDALGQRSKGHPTLLQFVGDLLEVRTDRPSRSSFVTTSESPSRR